MLNNSMDSFFQSTEEKPEAQRSELNWPEHIANKWRDQNDLFI